MVWDGEMNINVGRHRIDHPTDPSGSGKARTGDDAETRGKNGEENNGGNRAVFTPKEEDRDDQLRYVCGKFQRCG